MRDRLHYLFLNIGHFLDHLLMLIFATVAALALTREWGMSYGALIAYATPGFVAFGAFAIPAGWLADRWSREAMMTVFFVGCGLASASVALATSPMQIGVALFLVGVFAAIYHPVGIALVLEGHARTGMRIAINGVWGNMGVAVAALLTGLLIDSGNWRTAFVLPGLVCALIGVAYGLLIWRTAAADTIRRKNSGDNGAVLVDPVFDRDVFVRVLAIIFFTTALGGLVFQSTTFALPKVLAERTVEIGGTASFIGWLAFFAFTIGSVGQLIVGYFVDRASPRIAFVIVAALQVVFFTLMISASGWWAAFVAAGFMFAAFGQIPINDVLIGRVAKNAWRSRILAVRYTVTISVMASSVPFIAWVHAHHGFATLFGILAVTAFLVLLAVAALPRLREPALPDGDVAKQS